MIDLGKHTGAVLSAYGISLAMIAVLIAVTLIQSRKVKRRLEEVERNDG